jgi:hypothetical protein
MSNSTPKPPERGTSMFIVSPDQDRESIAIQAYETFCSVNDLLLDLADSLDDKARHMAVAIYQLSELGLLLVEKSLANEQSTSGV